MRTEQKISKPSDGLRALMREHKRFLSKQTGVHGQCSVCRRDILKSELCGRPTYADGRKTDEIICVDCIDAHSKGVQ